MSAEAIIATNFKMVILKYTTKRDRFEWCVGAFFSIVTSLIPAASTIIIGKLFNEVTLFTSGKVSSETFMSKTLALCTVLFVFAAIDLVVASMNGIVWRIVGFQVGHRTRLSLFKAYCDGDLTWMDSKTDAVGVASQAFEDIKKIEISTGIAIAGCIETLTTLISCYAVAFYFSWAVTLVCMAGLPVIFLVIALTNPFVEKYAGKRKRIENNLNSKLHFILDALNTVKVFRKQRYEVELTRKLAKEIYTNDTKMWQVSSIQQSIIRFMTLLMFVQGFYFGSYMVRHKGLSTGAVMSTFWACIEGIQSLQNISLVMQLISEGKVSAERLERIMDQDSEKALKNTIGMVRPITCQTTNINFRDVVFSYPSRPELVLCGLNMELAAGETHYIIGPSGCGKSSIASILLKQYPIQAGKVSIGDNIIESMAPYWIHENITLVEQSAKLFDLPILDNLKMAARDLDRVSDEICEQALRVFKADFVFDLPEGILTRGSYPLSGGQKQRIQLAKAWISNSPIMVFDESTSAMDPVLEKQAMEEIHKFRNGKTSIIITHNLANIPNNYPLYLIEDGEAFRFNSLQEMNHKRARISRMASTLWVSQFRDSYAHELDTAASLPIESHKLEIISEVQSVVTTVDEKVSNTGASKGYSEGFSEYMDYLKTIKSKTMLVLGMVAIVAQAVLTPVFSLVFSKLLMGILPGSNLHITKWAMMVLLIAALDGISTYSLVLLQYVASNWCFTTRLHIIDRLVKYETIQHDKVAYYKKLLLGDTEASRNIIVRYWRGWTNLISLGLTGLIWAMIVGWKLSLIGIAMVPIIVATTYYYKQVNYTWTTRLENEALEVKQVLEDIVTGFRTVKAQNLEKTFEKHFAEREEKLWEMAIRLSLFTSICGGVLEIFTPIAQGLLIYVGFKLISTGEYSPEKTMLVFSMLIFSLVTLDSVAKAIQQSGNAFEALPRIMTTYTDNSQIEVDHSVGYKPKNINWGAISFSRVTVKNTLLDSFSETLKQNQCTVILGPSGSGKTTISNMLLKLQLPTSGTIYIDGHDIQTLPNDLVRRNIAISAQMPINMFEGSILDNLCYGLDPELLESYADLVKKYCEQCNIHEYIESLEDGYQTNLKQELFSGGQMQRLGIVRALMAGPRVLILDEPTSALDAQNSQIIKNIIGQCLNEGISVILITHRHEMVSLADKVIDIFTYA